MREMLIEAVAGGEQIRLAATDALEAFDGLPPCPESLLRGRWAGREVFTDHPLDGVLGKVAWYGKQFDDAEHVHPLLVRDGRGRIFPLEPRLVRMPMLTAPPPTPSALKRVAPRLMSALRPVVRARRPGARLHTAIYRGVETTAMSYLDKPVTDVFRMLDTRTVLGLMGYRGMPRPYFFVLSKDD